MSCTYSPDEAVCSLAELKDGWLAFRQSVLTELGGEYPQLVGNPALADPRL